MNNRKTKKTVVFGILIILSCILAITQRSKMWLLWIPPLEIEKLTSQIKLPVSFTANLQDLSTKNLDKLMEIEYFRISANEVPIMAISEDGSQQTLMAINASGKFVHWKMESRTVVKQFDFRAAYTDSTNFSEDGSRLLAAGGTVLWNTASGETINGQDDFLLGDDGLKSVLDPLGLVIMNFTTTIDAIDLRNHKVVIYSQLNDCLFTELENWHSPLPIQQLAFDRSGSFIAYILPNGVVCVREFNNFLGYFIKYNL